MKMHHPAIIRSALWVALLVLCLASSGPWAATIREVPFDEMVRTSGLIVQVTVVSMSAEATGKAPSFPEGPPGEEDTSAPQRIREDQPAPSSQPSGGPVSARYKEGMTIFTHVTLKLDRLVKGFHTRTLHLKVPGGTVGEMTDFIPGLPAFEVGKVYFLFLRPDCEATGVPIVGVNQGYFQVLDDPATHRRVLADVDSDYLLGVEAGRLITRQDSRQAGARRLEAQLPHPAPGFQVTVPLRDEKVSRTWDSAARPLGPDELILAIREVPEWDKVHPASRGGRGGRP